MIKTDVIRAPKLTIQFAPIYIITKCSVQSAYNLQANGTTKDRKDHTFLAADYR